MLIAAKNFNDPCFFRIAMHGKNFKKIPCLPVGIGRSLRFNLIFRRGNQGNYTKKAFVYEDILSISIDREREENLKPSQPITHWDLAKRLMKKNQEFRDRYKDPSTRNIKISNRIENTRKRTRGKLEDLIYLGLMKKGEPTKEARGTGMIDTFTYTPAGILIAWLIEGLNPNANNRIYEILTDGFKSRDYSSSITIFKFLGRCRYMGMFGKSVEYFYYLVHLDNSNIKNIADLLTNIFDSSFGGSEVQTELLRIWYETIQDLEPDVQKLMLYRTKMSLERRFENNQINPSKQYEEFRFKLRSDFDKIAIPGYCETCKCMQNIALPYLELTNILTSGNYDIRIKYPVCNTKDSLLISNL
jgi:hypothetical protein